MSQFCVSSGSGDNKKEKMDWMYKDSTKVVDREEYLLGRKIDKQFETGYLPPEKSEGVPASVFSGTPVESQVDIARKLQEDPLYLIKKKEIESREQLLKNPRKVKQLQEMVARQKAAAEKLKRKQMKKEKKKKRKDLDALLVEKCQRLFGGVDASKLAALDNSSGSSSYDSESELSKRGNKGKGLDRMLAEKYKKVVGKLDSKKLAELSCSTDSSEDEDKFKSNKSKKKEKSLSPSSESQERTDMKERKIKYSKNRTCRKYSSESEENERYERKQVTNSRDKNDRSKDTSAIKRKQRDVSSDSEESQERSSSKRRSKENTNHYRDKSRVKDHTQISENRVRKHENQPVKRPSLHKRHSKHDDGLENNKRKKSSKNDRRKEALHLGTRGKRSSSVESIIRQEKKSKRSKGKKHKDDKLRKKETSSYDSDSSSNDRKRSETKHYKKNKKAKNPRHKDTSEDSSSAEQSSEEDKKVPLKQYGLVLPANYVPKEKQKEETRPVKKVEKDNVLPKREERKKLTAEEKEAKLKEMMSNAKWRDDLRDQNIKAFEEKQKAEKDDYVYNEDFMRNQMAYAMSQGTVESRVKANINTIQRSGGSMNENFARRK